MISAILKLMNRAQPAPEGQGWHEFVAFAEVDLIDGSRDNGPLMRRPHKDKFQYRHMTESEKQDYREQTAW